MAGLSQPIKTGPCFSDNNAFVSRNPFNPRMQKKTSSFHCLCLHSFLPRKHGKHGAYPRSVISTAAEKSIHFNIRYASSDNYQIEMTMPLMKSFLPILPYILQSVLKIKPPNDQLP